jgi:four helix bundle protein
MAHANSFRELEVYKLSRELSRKIFEISKEFPKEEKYSLTDQVRRASRSIGAQIAEAWSKRRYEKHFISKLTDADGEQQETQHWLEVANDCNYINFNTLNELVNMCEQIGEMINGMIYKAHLFCKDDH